MGVDDEKSFYDATCFFLNKGISNIALASTIHNLGVGKLRIKGYQNVSQPKMAISDTASNLKKKIKDLFVNDKIQALLCTDFESTLIANRLAYEQNYTIPKNLKLLGYILLEIAEFLTPSISYIEQHPKNMGAAAFQLLKQQIEVHEASIDFKKEVITTNLVHLESTKF